jgi:glycosidase
MMKLLLLCIAIAAAPLAGQAQSVDRIDPPFWWAGMKQRSLQLMLHGQGLDGLQARVRHAGVRVVRSRTLPNPNYLVVDLDIAPTARPGTLKIDFVRGGKPLLTQAYELRRREPGSANRQGFGPADAVYLLVPDRFANGDPANDNDPALGDPADRADKGGRHGGDLQGIANHLDYIAGLGFTQVWPTPLVENGQPRYSYHGYSATDLYRIDPRFGSNEDYRRLVAAARAKGLGFIQDMAPNHIGSGHHWMNPPTGCAKEGPSAAPAPAGACAGMHDLPTPDWLNNPPGADGQGYRETNHRHVSVQDLYAAPGDRAGLTDGWFVPTMPDLNQRQPLLATYLTQNAIWWIEYAGLSGIRVDTHPYADKQFLSRWVAAILAEYPRLSLVGEEMTEHPVLVAYWLRGRKNHDGYVSHMPGMMDFPLHGTLRQALLEPEGQGYGQGFGRLYEALVNDLLYHTPSALWLFEGNHDTNRIFSALGEDPALMRLALVYMATIHRTPQMFYGTELLMTSPLQRDDGAVRADFPGGWPGDPVNAFTGEGLGTAQRDMQSFVKRLFNWRKSATAVHHGRLMHYVPDRGTYTFFRHDERSGAKVMVVLSKATEAVALDPRRFAGVLPAAGARGTELFSGRTIDLSAPIIVPPRSALVIDVR